VRVNDSKKEKRKKKEKETMIDRAKVKEVWI
jgi:hypothetical protein